MLNLYQNRQITNLYYQYYNSIILSIFGTELVSGEGIRTPCTIV
jgi:hypothetical protein